MTETHDTINVDLDSADLDRVFTITYTLTDEVYKEVVPPSVEQHGSIITPKEARYEAQCT